MKQGRQLPTPIFLPRCDELPTRLARLPRVSAIVVATAAATTTASTAAAAEPASAAAARTIRLRPRFVHGQRTPAVRVSVESGDCRLGFIVVRHLHEAESTGPPCVTVRYHCYAFDCSVRLEKLTKVSFGRAEREVSYKNFLHAISFWLDSWVATPCTCLSAVPGLEPIHHNRVHHPAKKIKL